MTLEMLSPSSANEVHPHSLPERLWPVKSPVDTRVVIRHTLDMIEAREKGLRLALEAGCSATQLLLVQTIISELARNIILYAGSGEIHLERSDQDGLRVLTITAIDEGSGITSIEDAMTSGYSTSGGLGLGLPGIRQMANEFEIFSQPGTGTKVTAKMRFI